MRDYRGNTKHERWFLETFNNIKVTSRRIDIWTDFIHMASCSLSNVFQHRFWIDREFSYLDTIAKYDKEDHHKFPKLLSITTDALRNNPDQDFLGRMFMMLNLGNERQGQFFTPYTVSKAMAEMIFDEKKFNNKNYITVNDPCCGAGAMLIAFANVCRERDINYQARVLFIAQDIDIVAAQMCYIQLTLLGCAGMVIVDDSLLPDAPLDKPFGVWELFMTNSPLWKTRQMFKELKERTK